MNKRINKIQWGLFAAGITAVIALAALNIYTIYSLRSNSIQNQQQAIKIQVAEFADRMRYSLFEPFEGLGTLDMATLEASIRNEQHFTSAFTSILDIAAKDSVFKSIYYTDATAEPCTGTAPMHKFEAQNNAFTATEDFPPYICDGLGIARTEMKTLINGYQFNNKVLFDSERTMVVALVNQNEQYVFGYLVMPIDINYLVNSVLQPKLVQNFGADYNSAITVWLRDWTNNTTIASSDPSAKFDSNRVQFRQEFSDFLNYWRLYVGINESSLVAATNASYWFNMIIFGIAVIMLVLAILFLFLAARRERSLVDRQSEFLANVTHELKTPLSVMQAAGENLADGRVENQERLQTYGNHIYKESIRLRKMIEKLLDVAKVDAGKTDVVLQPVNITALLQNLVEVHKPYFKEHGFTFESYIPDLETVIEIDENSLETVFSNICNNAVKYSNENKFMGIYVTEDAHTISIEFKDRGIGLTEAEREHIFEKFYRAQDSLDAQTQGYGLGLSIVKNLVLLNNGTITVESTKGLGTSFTLTFPKRTNTEMNSSTTTLHEPTNQNKKPLNHVN